MKIAVIGGVAAGTSAAAKARRENESAEIVIFEQGSNISYAGCGLPYYISGVTSSRDQVIINTPQEFQEKYQIEVRIKHQVTEIKPDQKKIKYLNLSNDSSGQYSYDKLIIATGAHPVELPIAGNDLKGVVKLRRVRHADRIKEIIKKRDIQQTVIVGGGLIGLEMAEAFSELGLRVTVIEQAPQVLAQFSPEMAQLVEEHLKEKNVDLVLAEAVKEFKGQEWVEQVITEDNRKLKADLVLTSVGIQPGSKLAEQAGIETGASGAIKVNFRMETSAVDIYAAGDCAETTNLITSQPVWMPLGSTANKQGRTAGANAAGSQAEHQGVLETVITKIFDLTVARTGLTEEKARQAGFEPLPIKITAPSHAGYYPQRKKIELKGIFAQKSGRLLGAEAVGKKGVDKRIDVCSTAIYSQLTASDLFQLDLGYAPPYSTPKDAVAILGMVAEGKM